MQKKEYWLKPKKQIFRDFKKHVLDKGNIKLHRIFIDRQADILFVAHLDTVLPPKFKRQTKNRIYATGLDDRFGCMIAYNLSEQLGADLLLTDHEESFATTAKYHDCKEYNWIAEFDKAGDDVVTYQLDNPEFRQALKEYWILNFGTYSDISQLYTEACCMNVGIGYEKAHSEDSYICLKTMEEQVRKFVKFFEKHKDTAFAQDFSCPDLDSDRSVYYNYDRYEDVCELCGLEHGELIYGKVVCEHCFNELLRQEYYV